MPQMDVVSFYSNCASVFASFWLFYMMTTFFLALITIIYRLEMVQTLKLLLFINSFLIIIKKKIIVLKTLFKK